VTKRLSSLLLLCFLAAVLTGCSYSSAPGVTTISEQASSKKSAVVTNADPSTKIKHVIVIIQENRSFVNLFSGFPGADAPTFGYEHDGTQVPLSKIDFGGADLSHSFLAGVADWNDGAMNGFDTSSPSAPLYPYSYLDPKLVKPYWSLAKSYALADRMFPTQFGASFSAHLNLIAGTDQLSSTLAVTDWASDTPWGCDAPSGTTASVVNSKRQVTSKGPFPCFTQFKTMADTLDAAGVSWKYYAPQVVGCSGQCDYGGLTFSAFDAISNVRYGPDWANVVSPQTTILQDVPNGNLASVSWVVPDFRDSDHPGNKSDTGPSWVASVVNAVGQSQYWNSTAIVVLWDDWGGWYDDAAPPQLDFLGLGIRVGCIVVSPYAKTQVIHTQYEYGSILKFIEQTFKLASLGYTDERASSIVDSFNFKRTPRSFVPIPAKYPASYFVHEKPSLQPPDRE
jgi:phospholipase C